MDKWAAICISTENWILVLFLLESNCGFNCVKFEWWKCEEISICKKFKKKKMKFILLEKLKISFCPKYITNAVASKTKIKTKRWKIDQKAKAVTGSRLCNRFRWIRWEKGQGQGTKMCSYARTALAGDCTAIMRKRWKKTY